MPTLPTEPGRYYWSEWKCVVEVTQRGAHLYVTPPCKGAVEIRITRKIAGTFKKES